jgi:Zinc carboxypeptidase/Carboxypeptidase activation peptide
MVKLFRILFIYFILIVQDCVECFQNVVVVNNKQMTYNRKGELVELDKVNIDKKVEKKPVKIVEKSNIFKTSSFVTGSSFKTGNKDFKSGLITKQQFLPTRGSVPTKKQTHPTKTPKIHRSSTAFPTIPFLPTTTTQHPPLVTALIFSDDFTSTENSLHNTYDDLFKNDFNQYQTVTERPRPIESTIFVYSTPSSPTTIIPIIVKKPKKNKKTTTTPIPMHEHIVQNLDYYRKILALNCTKKESEKQENGEQATEQVIVTITPKPTMNIKIQSERVSLIENPEDDDDEDTPIEGKKDKKKKKHCKKKKKHGHHSGHGHHGHGHSHEHLLQHLFHKGSHSYEHGHHHDKDSHSESYSYEHGHGHSFKDKKKKKGVHQVHEHIHHLANKKKKKWPKKHEEEIVYYDIPLAHGFEKAGDIFDTFYGFFEDALTSKEVVPYANHRDLSSYSESESDDSWYDGGGHHLFGGGHQFHKRKRSIDDPLKNQNNKKPIKKRSIDPSSPRKSMKITVTSEYDDSIAGQTTPIYPPHEQHLQESSTRKPKKDKKQKIPNSKSSEESDEYTLYDEIMGFRDDFDDSGDIDDDMKDDESIEYYDDDEAPSNRLPDGDVIEHTSEDYSEEVIVPSESIFDNVTNMFSSIGTFFSSLTGVNDRSRKPPRNRYAEYDEDYEDEGRATSTTEKFDMPSKRPKRENVLLPWYQPSFLFSNNQDETESSTTQGNWLIMPWQRDHEEENEIVTTTLQTPKKLPNLKVHRKNYNNYQLWRITPKSKDDVNYLEDFKISYEGLKIHWLKGPSSKGISDVVVPPKLIEVFKEFLDENEIQFDIKSRDIQHAIQFENQRLKKRDQIELEATNGHSLTWHRYHSYKNMQSFFDYLKRKFSNNVELIQIGWSYEGRPLTVVKVTHHVASRNLPKEPRNSSEKPAIFIQSGTESHEWLPIACATYILNNIVHKIDGNDTVGEIMRSFDWYVMPVMNPDGYEYSMNHERLWQKTRSKHFASNSFWSST